MIAALVRYRDALALAALVVGAVVAAATGIGR